MPQLCLKNLIPSSDQRLVNTQRLTSSWPQLTHFFQGGIPFGTVCEWGLPWGHEVRDIILSFLNSKALERFYPSPWILWVHARTDTIVYPPAWQARGVDLSQIRFAYSQSPLQDLKTAFLSSFFKIIIIDLDSSHFLRSDDWAFLAQIARKSGALILVLQDFFLTSRKGNVWAKIRLNSWKQDNHTTFLQALKGLPPQKIELNLLRDYCDTYDEHSCRKKSYTCH